MTQEELGKRIWDSGCFAEGDTVVVGFSGGADSLALLDGLMGLARGKNLRVVALHVHHSIRGEEADRDAACCEQMAKRLSAEFRFKKVNAPGYAFETGESTENAARILRYEALAETAKELEEEQLSRGEYGDVRVAVAHTKSDLAETVLLRILRGTGPDGLACMSSVGTLPGYDRMLVRPLLSLTAEEVRTYCEGRGFLPRKDSTNEDTAYARNRVRKELMPRLKEDYNPEVESALARLAGIAAMDRDFMEMWAEQLLTALEGTEKINLYKKEKKNSGDGENGSVLLDRRELMGLHPAMGTRVIALALKKAGMTKDLSQVTLWAAWEMVLRGKGTGEAELSGGYRLKLDHDAAVVYRVLS